MCGYHCRVCGYYLLSSKCSEPINPTRTGTCLCTHVPLPLCTYCLLLTGCAQEQLLSSDNSTLWRKPNKPLSMMLHEYSFITGNVGCH